jgi:hypothetical protein
MATIWTGTLVINGPSGLLATPKTVYLNSAFTHKVSETEYVDNAGVTQTGTLVQYKLGDGADLVNLVFSGSYGPIVNSINTQPSVGTDTLNMYTIDVLDALGGTVQYQVTVETAKIWWIEAASLTESYMTVYNSTLDNRFNYIADETPANIESVINN